MTAFRVGMKVCCVDAENTYPTFHRLKKGAVYTVREVYICPERCIPGLRFSEFVNDIHPTIGIEVGYRASRFRPIVSRPTSIAVFQAMLTGKKAGVEA